MYVQGNLACMYECVCVYAVMIKTKANSIQQIHKKSQSVMPMNDSVKLKSEHLS